MKTLQSVFWVLVGIIIVILIALAIKGNQSAGADAKPTVQPAALMAQVTGTPSPEPQPSETSEPTIDYSSVYPEQTSAAAKVTAGAGMQMRANAASTMLALTPTALAMAMQFGTPTAQAMLTERAVGTQNALATIETGSRQTAFIVQQNQSAVETKAALDALSRKDFFAKTGIILGAVIAFVLIYEFIRFVGTRVTPAPAAVEANEPTKNEAASEVELNQVNHGDNAAFLHEIKISKIEKALLQDAAIVLGAKFSRRSLNGRDSSGKRVDTWKEWFTEGRAEQITIMLRIPDAEGVSFGVLLADGSTGLTQDGYEWLGLKYPDAPPPLPSGFTPIKPQNTALPHPTPPQEAGGVVGGGLEKEQKG